MLVVAQLRVELSTSAMWASYVRHRGRRQLPHLDLVRSLGARALARFGQLANLEELNLWQCTSLRSLPESKSHF